MAQFRRGLAGARPGRVGERSRGHVLSVLGVGQGRGGAGGGVRRRPGAPAAAAGNAGEGRFVGAGKQAGELWWS
jgi:hypothetical protein